MAQDEMTAQEGGGPEQGGRRAAVSNAIVALMKECFGRGPVAAKTYFDDDWVFVTLEGGPTRTEETLLAAGEQELVRTVRLRFQEAMRDRMTSAVEDIVGRRVLTYHSQILFDPMRTVEIFLLERGDQR